MGLCLPRGCGCAFSSSSLIITGSGGPGDPLNIEGASPERITEAERLALAGGDLFNGLVVWTTDEEQLWAYGTAGWFRIGGSTEIVTAGFVAETGWTVGSCYGLRSANVVSILTRATRTGADITVNATGNLTDSPVMTIPASLRGASTLAQNLVGGGHSSYVSAGYCRPSDGQVVLTASGLDGGTIVTGAAIDLGGTLIVD